LNKVKQNIENTFKIKENDLNEKLENCSKKYDDLIVTYENSKQVFEKDKSNALALKENEFQKVIDDLEKRFEGDYSKFIQSYKENLARTLQEKSDEFSREKDSLTNMYEKKINELESKEQNLLKQLKDMKKSLSIYSTPDIQSTPRTNDTDNSQEPSTCERLHLTNLQSNSKSVAVNAIMNKEQDINRLNEENENLIKQIKNLEAVISRTDNHFEAEIEKLKYELEIDFRQRLEHELGQKEVEHQYLLNQLNIQNEQNLQNELETLRKQLLKPNENADEKLNIYKQQQQDKFNKLKQELNRREKQVEQLEIQSKKLKFDFDQAINAEKENYDKLKKDADEQFNIKTQRIRQENESLQVLLQNLKKTNVDSDKVIQNLKDEMNNNHSNYLDEIKALKLNSEREKDMLQQKIDSLNSKLLKTEKSLHENDAKLKEQYGQELTKMNAKMKDMMKSHANAIELLKKQHTAEKAKHGIEDRYKQMTFSVTCQTDVTFNEIKLLETFREKYLETVNKMKSDMVRKFDEQSVRVTDKLRQEINEERKSFGDDVRNILFKKLEELLDDYRVSDSIVSSIVHELNHELNKILTQKKTLPVSTIIADQQILHQIELDSSSDFIGKLNNHKISSPRSNASSNGSTENKRLNNLTYLQKHMEHDSSSVHSADIQTINKNKPYSANLRKLNELTGKSNDHLQPFYSSSMSSFQNHDTKSDSGNGSSCHETSSKQRVTPTFKNNDAQMTTSTTSTNSSSHSKQLSYEEQSSVVNASPKSATRNYKYTPLRQSCSNLNQITQLSPFSFNQEDSEVYPNNTSNTRKERPTSASNLILRTNMMLASLNDSKPNPKRTENDIYSILSNNSNDASNNTLRSFSVTNGFDKESSIIDTTSNRYGSLPRSANSNNQPNAKLLTIPGKTRPFSAGYNSNSTSNLGLSIFKESTNNLQTIESKSTKTGATITTNNNNYNYAIESDYNDQFVDDNLPVKELDVSSSTVSSSVSATVFNSKPTTVTSNSNNNNVMLDTYQKLRTTVHSASYRPLTTNQITSNPISKKLTPVTSSVNNTNKINGDLISSSTSSLYNNRSQTINSTNNNSSISNLSIRNQQAVPRKKQTVT
jgi:hypothetical protein